MLLLEQFRLRATGTPYAYCHPCWRIKSEENRKAHVQKLRGPLGNEWAEWRITGIKWCRRCDKQKPVAEFHRRKTGVPSVYCRACAYLWHRRWLRTDAGKKSIRKYEQVPARRRKNHARAMAQHAVALGILVRQPCDIAGCRRASQMHHEDYTKPLEVRWLCREHHRARHDAMKSPLD